MEVASAVVCVRVLIRQHPPHYKSVVWDLIHPEINPEIKCLIPSGVIPKSLMFNSFKGYS